MMINNALFRALHFCFFSEPHSILEPPLSEEEVREMQRKFFEEQRRLVELENEKRMKEIEEMERKREEEEQRRRNEVMEAQRKEQERQLQLQREREAKMRKEEEEEKRQNKHVRFQEEQQNGEQLNICVVSLVNDINTAKRRSVN